MDWNELLEMDRNELQDTQQDRLYFNMDNMDLSQIISMCFHAAKKENQKNLRSPKR